MNLVTGASGHIGNVLVRQLLERGERVRALVRPGRPSPALAGLEVEIVPGDVLEPRSLERALDGVAVAYHLAARISLAPGPDPETERVNLEGTRNVIAACLKTSVRRLVYASTVYALRLPAEGLVDESLPFDPDHARGAYDRSKAAASLEVQKAAADGLEAVIACPTAVAGPFDFHGSEAGRAVRLYMQPGLKFHLDGGYDFVDVRDAAHGLLLAAGKGRRGETYILGGERLSVREVVETVREAAGVWQVGVRVPGWVADLAAAALPLFSERPLVTPYSLAAVRSNANISHARASRELGYQPRPARQAITDAVRWWQLQGQPGEQREMAEALIKAAV